MATNYLDSYYLNQKEPFQSCLIFLRRHLLAVSPLMSEQLKYGTATFQFKGKMFCYFSIRKKTQKLYIGFVNGFRISHPLLMSEGRKQIKVFYIDPNGDVDIKSLNAILELALKT